MKKFLIVLLCLLLTFPFFAAAAPSPTLKDMVWCEPEMSFQVLDTVEFDLTLENYELIEALEVAVERPLTLVTWHLLVEIIPNDIIKTVIISEDLVIADAEITDEGNIIVDFTNIAPGTYLLYFFREEPK